MNSKIRYKEARKDGKGSKIKITSLLQIQQLESFQRGQTERKDVSKSVSLEGIQGWYVTVRPENEEKQKRLQCISFNHANSTYLERSVEIQSLKL